MRGRRLCSSRRWTAVLPALLLTLLWPMLAGCTPPGLPAPLSPSAAPTASDPARPAGTVVVGVDDASGGFNPHALADFSAATTAVAGLVLPSASRVTADGSIVPDPDLLVSAAVTATDPYTVTYKLNPDAAWSDGTPITADDFSYLRDAMVANQDTVDPAGYADITAIRGSDGGKTVTVVFDKAFPLWRSLFAPLLPAHIMKDSPGGWAGALAAGLPVSGSRYKMTDDDATTGEITLVRNDKFWGTQPGPASVVLRIGTAASLVAALDRGDLQAIWVSPDSAGAVRLAASVAAAHRRAVAESATVQLLFDTRSGPTADPAVRRAIGAGLDLAALRQTLARGNPGSVLPVTSWVAQPATDGTDGTAIPGLPASSTAAAADALLAAGFQRGGAYLRRAGVPLRLVLAYPTTDATLAQVAADVQARLGEMGIEVDLRRDTPAGVLTDLRTSAASLALAVVARPASAPLAIAAQFGCPAAPAGRGTDSGGTTTAAPSDSLGGGTAPVSGQPVLPGAAVLGTAGGFCDPSLDEQVAQATAAASAGPPSASFTAALAAIDSHLWVQLPAVPIGERVRSFAVVPALVSVTRAGGPGWTVTGPLAGLADWPTG